VDVRVALPAQKRNPAHFVDLSEQKGDDKGVEHINFFNVFYFWKLYGSEQ